MDGWCHDMVMLLKLLIGETVTKWQFQDLEMWCCWSGRAVLFERLGTVGIVWPWRCDIVNR